MVDMTIRDWLKVIVLILLPVNAWLAVHFYLHQQKQRAVRESQKVELREEARVRHVIREWFGIKEGQPIRYPFHPSALVLKSHPPIGKGIPILFLNIATRADKEIWDLAIKEALNASPHLHVVLVHEMWRRFSDPSKIQALLQSFNHPRLSALVGERWVRELFGQGFIEGDGAILLILCDGQGIIRAIEAYPERKVFQSWEEEVEYWRPKLHQVVKRVLDKFFPKQPGRGDR